MTTQENIVGCRSTFASKQSWIGSGREQGNDPTTTRYDTQKFE